MAAFCTLPLANWQNTSSKIDCGIELDAKDEAAHLSPAPGSLPKPWSLSAVLQAGKIRGKRMGGNNELQQIPVSAATRALLSDGIAVLGASGMVFHLPVQYRKIPGGWDMVRTLLVQCTSQPWQGLVTSRSLGNETFLQPCISMHGV